MHIVYLIIALVFNAFANIMMKMANTMNMLPENAEFWEKVTGLYFSWPFLTGLVAFGLNLLFYTQALNKMALSVAYPIMTGAGFTLIGIAGYYLFSEKLTTVQILGILCVFIGIILIARPSAAS
jgi:multidrug transporter EmrE-like cation transporter